MDLLTKNLYNSIGLVIQYAYYGGSNLDLKSLFNNILRNKGRNTGSGLPVHALYLRTLPYSS